MAEEEALEGNTFEKFIPVLLLVVVVLSFVVGILWQKVRNIEGVTSSDKVAGATAEANVDENSALSIKSIKTFLKIKNLLYVEHKSIRHIIF